MHVKGDLHAGVSSLHAPLTHVWVCGECVEVCARARVRMFPLRACVTDWVYLFHGRRFCGSMCMTKL